MTNETILNQPLPPREQHVDQWKLFFSPGQWAFFFALILVGLFLRWYQLDLRPIHHDESQHGMFGKYFYDFPDHNYYQYNPMLHGPLLYNIYRAVYSTFDSTNWSIRMPMALLGSLYMLLPFLFRRYLSPLAVLFATAGIALGPTAIYWSRFAREDYYTLFGLFSMLVGIGLAPERWRSVWIMFGLTLQFCSKENSFVHAAVFVGYLGFDLIMRYIRTHTERNNYFEIVLNLAFTALSLFLIVLSIYYLTGTETVSAEFNLLRWSGLILFTIALLYEVFFIFVPNAPDSLLHRCWSHLTRHRWHALFGFLVCALIYCYLYTAGFRHSAGILDGLGRKSIGYWVEHHNMERIKGPFLFQFYTLTWYEFPFILFFFAHLIHFYSAHGRKMQFIGLGLLAAAVVVLIPFWFSGEQVESNIVGVLFKLKDQRDLMGLVILLLHPFIVSVYHHWHGDRTLAAWGYLFTAFFFTYSYLGEKVPWLSMYPLYAGLIYLPLYFDDALRRNPLTWHRAVPWRAALFTAGTVSAVLGLLFILEDMVGATNKIAWEEILWKNENSSFLLAGVTLIAFGFLDGYRKILGTFRLSVLIMTLVCLYNLRAAIMTNFTFTGHASEYISQVHTSPEFHNIALDIKHEMKNAKSGNRPTVLGRGESTWPLTWYMVGVEGYNFDVPADKKREDYDYIFETWENDEQLKNVPAGFTARRLDFRGWWVPDFNQITLKRFLRYGLNHQPWGPTGYTYLLFLSKSK